MRDVRVALRTQRCMAGFSVGGMITLGLGIDLGTTPLRGLESSGLGSETWLLSRRHAWCTFTPAA